MISFRLESATQERPFCAFGSWQEVYIEKLCELSTELFYPFIYPLMQSYIPYAFCDHFQSAKSRRCNYIKKFSLPLSFLVPHSVLADAPYELILWNVECVTLEVAIKYSWIRWGSPKGGSLSFGNHRFWAPNSKRRVFAECHMQLSKKLLKFSNLSWWSH